MNSKANNSFFPYKLLSTTNTVVEISQRKRASLSVLFFFLVERMELTIYIKRRFMLMFVIYGYFYSILEIIIWTVSVWMKIIFYSSLEKLSAVVDDRFPSFPPHNPTSQWKWLFFLFSTTICLAFGCGLVFPIGCKV